MVDQHLNKKRGKNTTDDDSRSSIKKQIFCSTCKMEFASQEDLQKHMETKRHKYAGHLSQNSSQKDDASQPLSDILVECKDQGVKMSADNRQFSVKVELGVKKTVTLKVTNQSSQLTFKLLSWGDLASERDYFQYIQPSQMCLSPGDEGTLQLKVCVSQVGELYRHVIFSFHAALPLRLTYIFHFSCSDSFVDDLKKDAIEPYRSQKPRFIPPPETVIKGVQLPRKSTDKLSKELPLKSYRAGKLLSYINRGFEDKGEKLNEQMRSEMKVLRSVLEEELAFSRYAKKLSTLLHCEEAQVEVELHKYDMIATMKRRGASSLVLEVPGLAENRPSVLRGDHILARILDKDGQIGTEEYQGFVHDVEQTRLVLGFHKNLLNIFQNDLEFHVQFVLNRMPLLLQHRAIETAEEEEQDMESLLFPSYDVVGVWGTFHDPAQPLSFYSVNPAPNKEQDCAIRHIVAGTSRPAPYIVFGPPGTGKTYTIVEAIKQVVKCFPHARILACAPSNSAADNIAERLYEHLDKDVLLRMNAASRNRRTIPQKLLDICNEDKSGHTIFPGKETLQKKRVIVCTLITAGRLASACFPPEHFTHVFIDEVSQATEPESLVPVINILSMTNRDKGGQLVLAGDPKQLGPVLHSPLARQFNLDESLMERLMRTLEPYKRFSKPKDGQYYDVRVLTKLVKNYRSHPEILIVPNKLFYDGELEPFADKSSREQLCGWDGLPNKKAPVVFHAVIGEDMQEAGSPSFFNPQEVSVVISYITKLVGMKISPQQKIEARDIGIISPYKKQVQKIRSQLTKLNIDDIMVGSVEEFQGREKKIIIISSVRSQPKFMQTDLKFRLGFLTNPKRFNVALTRAKALLVVIGNPTILSCDHNWRTFITYCNEMGYVREPQLMTAMNEEYMEKLLDQMSITQQ